MTAPLNCTLRKVASAAGVSLAAASFALSGKGRVSSATKKRVRIVARKLGYRQDLHVSEFMRRVRQDQPVRYRETLAVIDSWPEQGGWLRPTANRRYATGIRQRAEELGYKLEEFWLREPRMTDERMEEILKTRGIRGLIIPPVIDPTTCIHFDWSRYATVTIGPSLNLPVNRVCNHRFRTVTLAIERLQELGYRKIGFVMVQHPIPLVDEFWCSGFHTHLASVPSAQRVPPVLQPGIPLPVSLPDPERVAELAIWFRKHQPDAILLHTLHQLAELAAAGIEPGQDCAIAFLNWETGLEHLAGVDQHAVLMGATAVECLMGLLTRQELGLPEAPQEIMIGCVWRDGPSAPPRRDLAKREARCV